MKSFVLLTTLVGAGLAATANCPAAGSTDSQGRYACNPAHQYPEGQKCMTIDGCLVLTDASGKPVVNAPAPASTSASVNCPAPGSTDSQGRYSCNPAHAYPNGQKCLNIDGCLVLTDADGKPIVNAPAATTTAQPTGACPAPGATDSQGRYSCNPAHQYPEGQKCTTVDGCLVLVDANGKPVISSAAAAQPTAACPASGSTDSQGRYSCNPAHQYPEGQKCTIIDGCLLLVDANGKPVIASAAAAQPTAACPAGGSTDSQGRYSCNPAHQYPEGQKCMTVDGCLVLVDANGKPIVGTAILGTATSGTAASGTAASGTATSSSMPLVSAGAATLGGAGAGMLAFAAGLGALVL
ncbi:hypothetical protein E4U41_001567 [Claviceps citrina]|nr:hypothetical protein E4U41_001567 [Claviceps citrina]